MDEEDPDFDSLNILTLNIIRGIIDYIDDVDKVDITEEEAMGVFDKLRRFEYSIRMENAKGDKMVKKCCRKCGNAIEDGKEILEAKKRVEHGIERGGDILKLMEGGRPYNEKDEEIEWVDSSECALCEYEREEKEC